jgi:hypothetical protein
MEPYSDQSAISFKLNSNDDWLRKRQGLALPAIPPTTLEARRYFFSKIHVFTTLASSNGKGKIDFEAFAQEWNRLADGKDRFYITTDVLCTYAKSWEKTSNIRASQELISDKMDMIEKTSKIFAASHQPFPAFLTAVPSTIQPSQGGDTLFKVDDTSLSIDMAPSRPIPPPLSSLPLVSPLVYSEHQLPTPSTSPDDLEPLQPEPEQVLYTTLPTASGAMCVLIFYYSLSYLNSVTEHQILVAGPQNDDELSQKTNGNG